MKLRRDVGVDSLNARSASRLPGWFGLKVVRLDERELAMQVQIQPQMLAPNGFLHAATVIALADTACGFATIAHLPDGAESFTTIELKCNFLGTATEGPLEAVAAGAHLGRTTQVWDAKVREVAGGRTLALFRCTQMVLWPKK
jgi:1,4-dihydroxy-2-naphthoyl-CoA hydrolase